MPDFWLTLEPYVHAACKPGRTLLYNPLNGKWLIIENESPAGSLLQRLLAPENLRVLGLSQAECNSPEWNKFIIELRSVFMGDLVATSLSQGKPIQLAPRPFIEMDIRRVSQPLEDCRQYLRELVLYLHSGCPLSCPGCQDAYRQFTCCTRQIPAGPPLSLDRVRGWLDELSSYPMQQVHLLGGNLFDYPEWDQLPGILINRPFHILIYFHPQQICTAPEKLAPLSGLNLKVKLTVFGTDDPGCVAQAGRILDQLHLTWEVQWVVASRTEAQAAQQSCASLGISPQLLPLYNGHNLDFFQECVFLCQEDITADRPQSKTIYANQLLNRLAYGRLTVLASGQVFSSLHTPSLGQLGEERFHVFIERELKSGQAWLATRESCAPCCNCLWSALCPPITEYEYVLKKHDLCSVKNQASADLAVASV